VVCGPKSGGEVPDVLELGGLGRVLPDPGALDEVSRGVADDDHVVEVRVMGHDLLGEAAVSSRDPGIRPRLRLHRQVTYVSHRTLLSVRKYGVSVKPRV
jgi:hypothetical protein